MMIKVSDRNVMEDSSAGGSVIHRIDDDSSIVDANAPDKELESQSPYFDGEDKGMSKVATDGRLQTLNKLE
jgi:hypothetical protein